MLEQQAGSWNLTNLTEENNFQAETRGESAETLGRGMASEPVEDEDAFLYGDEDTNTAAKSTVSDFCACACVRVCRCVCVCVRVAVQLFVRGKDDVW